MEESKAVATADINAHNGFGKWAGNGETIEQPFEQTVDPSQLNFDFPQFDPKKSHGDGDEDEDESGCSEFSRSSSESYEDISDNVLAEMQNLENIFQNIGLNFRMIDRIGEGERTQLGVFRL